MPVSSGLQKYFDSKQKKKSQGDMKKKLQDIAQNIDPAFMQSFEAFHDRIMDIVEENPDIQAVVEEEVVNLDLRVKNSNRKHNMKKAASIIKVSEEV